MQKVQSLRIFLKDSISNFSLDSVFYSRSLEDIVSKRVIQFTFRFCFQILIDIYKNRIRRNDLFYVLIENKKTLLWKKNFFCSSKNLLRSRSEGTFSEKCLRLILMSLMKRPRQSEDSGQLQLLKRKRSWPFKCASNSKVL